MKCLRPVVRCLRLRYPRLPLELPPHGHSSDESDPDLGRLTNGTVYVSLFLGSQLDARGAGEGDAFAAAAGAAGGAAGAGGEWLKSSESTSERESKVTMPPGRRAVLIAAAAAGAGAANADAGFGKGTAGAGAAGADAAAGFGASASFGGSTAFAALSVIADAAAPFGASAALAVASATSTPLPLVPLPLLGNALASSPLPAVLALVVPGLGAAALEAPDSALSSSPPSTPLVPRVPLGRGAAVLEAPDRADLGALRIRP